MFVDVMTAPEGPDGPPRKLCLSKEALLAALEEVY